MVDRGEQNEVSAGDKVTISIGGDLYKLKEIFDLTRDRPVTDDGNTIGTNYTFSSGRHNVDILIEASTPDLATLDAYNNRTSAGDLPEQECIITYPPVSGSTAVTETFDAKFHTIKRTQGSILDKIKVRLVGVITSETQTWG